MQLTLFSNRRYKVKRKETTKEKKGKKLHLLEKLC